MKKILLCLGYILCSIINFYILYEIYKFITPPYDGMLLALTFFAILIISSFYMLYMLMTDLLDVRIAKLLRYLIRFCILSYTVVSLVYVVKTVLNDTEYITNSIFLTSITVIQIFILLATALLAVISMFSGRYIQNIENLFNKINYISKK